MDVDDRQAPMRQSDVTDDVHAGAVRAAVGHAIVHTFELVASGLRAGHTDPSEDTAHGQRVAA